MSYPSLTDLMTAGATTEHKCPRCGGRVTVPSTVQLVGTGQPRVRYEPLAKCHGCGVGFSWHSDRNPVSATAGSAKDRGLTDVWYCERQLDAPAPHVTGDDE